MAGLFGGDSPQPAPQNSMMVLPRPRPVRMPTPNDASIVNAAQRAREMALKRTGRMSTILTDQFRGQTGMGSGLSPGSALGA